MAKDQFVIAKLESIHPDRTQWKPYAPTLIFEDVYVQIPVSPEDVLEQKGGKTTITVDGLSVILDVVATSIDKMNARWMKSQQNPNRIYNPLDK